MTLFEMVGHSSCRGVRESWEVKDVRRRILPMMRGRKKIGWQMALSRRGGRWP